MSAVISRFFTDVLSYSFLCGLSMVSERLSVTVARLLSMYMLFGGIMWIRLGFSFFALAAMAVSMYMAVWLGAMNNCRVNRSEWNRLRLNICRDFQIKTKSTQIVRDPEPARGCLICFSDDPNRVATKHLNRDGKCTATLCAECFGTYAIRSPKIMPTKDVTRLCETPIIVFTCPVCFEMIEFWLTDVFHYRHSLSLNGFNTVLWLAYLFPVESRAFAAFILIAFVVGREWRSYGVISEPHYCGGYCVVVSRVTILISFALSVWVPMHDALFFYTRALLHILALAVLVIVRWRIRGLIYLCPQTTDTAIFLWAAYLF